MLLDFGPAESPRELFFVVKGGLLEQTLPAAELLFEQGYIFQLVLTDNCKPVGELLELFVLLA